MSSYADWAARWRVSLHFVAAALYLVFARPTVSVLLAGSPLVLVGLGVRAWAAGHLRREVPVVVSGPYAHLRHPLYLGTAFMLAGFGVAGGRLWLALVLVAYFLLLFIPTMRREERARLERTPDYATYAAQVPAFLPRPSPARGVLASGGDEAKFDAQLYLRNREWRAALGCVLLFLALWGKILWG